MFSEDARSRGSQCLRVTWVFYLNLPIGIILPPLVFNNDLCSAATTRPGGGLEAPHELLSCLVVLLFWFIRVVLRSVFYFSTWS